MSRFITYLNTYGGVPAPYGGGDTIEVDAGTLTVGTPTQALADYLEPNYLSVVSNGEIGEARFRYTGLWEHLTTAVPLYTPVQIWDTSTATDEAPLGTLVFDGMVVKHHLAVNGVEVNPIVIAYNQGDYLLHRIALHGQWRFDHPHEQGYFTDGNSGSAFTLATTDLIQTDTPLIFNGPDGLPNCCAQTLNLSDKAGTDNTIRIFDVPGRNQKDTAGHQLLAVPWKLSWAVAYLLNLNKAEWALDDASYNDTALTAAFGANDPVIANVNLEGRRLLEALRILLEPHGYVFSITPTTTSGKLHQIKFATRGGSTYTGTVAMPARNAAAADTTKAYLISADITIDASPVINTLHSYGDYLEFTTVCHTNPAVDTQPTLVPAWKTADLDYAMEVDGSTVNTSNGAKTGSLGIRFGKNYNSPDLISADVTGKPYGVGRMWLVNLGEAPAVDLEDLSSELYVDGNFNSIDFRRLEKPKYYDRNSVGGLIHEIDHVVEMSFDSGTHWGIVEKNQYRVLSDGMGIVFTNPEINRLGIHFNTGVVGGKRYWQALHDGTLQIRVLCSVKSEEKLTVDHQNDGAAVPLATEGVYHNEGYRKFVYDAGSAANSVYLSTYAPVTPSTYDDTTALTDITNAQAAMTNRTLVVGTLAVIMKAFGQYYPGMSITGIDNRMTFSPAPTILRTIYDFQAQHVQLILDNHKVRSVISSRPIHDDDVRAAKMGIHETDDLPEGPKYGAGSKKNLFQTMRDKIMGGN